MGVGHQKGKLPRGFGGNTRKHPAGAVLSPKQKAALDYYYGVSNFNKTDALRRAGYKKPDGALRVFSFPAVQKEMERREKANRVKYEVTYDRVVDEIAKVAFFNPMSVLEIDEDGLVTVDLTKPDAAEMAAISEIQVDEFTVGKGADKHKVTKVKVKPWNKGHALDMLMRHTGLSKEKTRIEGTLDLTDRILAARRRATGGETADSRES